MAFAGNAPARWLQMDATRRGFIGRCELYASYTLPKLCLPNGYDQNSAEVSHDFQSVGAQSVNHLANKIMLAGFAPSRPFFRMDASKEVRAEMQEVGLNEADIVDLLAQGEKDAVKELDRLALRPKLYEVVKNLIVLGNVLLCLEKDTARVIGLKKYCVRRSVSGQLLELIIKDTVVFDELDEAVQDAVRAYGQYDADHEVSLYRWVKRHADGSFYMDQWVDKYQLPKEFSGKWSEEKLPYRVLTWDLSDEAHYGTGLVEDYRGDFAGLSVLSKSQVIGAVLASEFRWLVNPAGMTKPEDFERSENGAAIPGVQGDVSLVESSKATDLQVTINMSSEYVNRIGKGFLLGASGVRQAERVTAEEIRLVANELETALGGFYSRLAVDMQLPMARWLMTAIGLGTDDKQFIPSIVTGLEALSRTGDLENLKLWLADMAALAGLPPPLLATMKMEALGKALAAPRRVDVAQFMKSQQEIAAEQAQARALEEEQMTNQAGAQAGVEVVKQQQGNNEV